MATQEQQLEEIYDSFINGQKKQMVEQIDEFGLYDVFSLLNDYLMKNNEYWYNEFIDIVTSYHFIKYR